MQKLLSSGVPLTPCSIGFHLHGPMWMITRPQKYIEILFSKLSSKDFQFIFDNGFINQDKINGAKPFLAELFAPNINGADIFGLANAIKAAEKTPADGASLLAFAGSLIHETPNFSDHFKVVACLATGLVGKMACVMYLQYKNQEVQFSAIPMSGPIPKDILCLVCS